MSATGASQSRREVLRKAGLGAAALFVAEETLIAKPAAALASQSDWRICWGCRTLYFPDSGVGACPLYNNGREDHVWKEGDLVSWNYVLWFEGAGSNFQAGWRWCRVCNSLFFAFNGTSRCPRPGPHDPSASGPYMLDVVTAKTKSNLGFQVGWAWCSKCQSLFYRPQTDFSYCPVWGTDGSGFHHQGKQSWYYALNYYYG